MLQLQNKNWLSWVPSAYLANDTSLEQQTEKDKYFAWNQAVCYLPGLTHGRHVVHLYSVSPFGIMYDNSADASPQLAFTISCYTLSPSIPTCNRSTCACTCGSNTRTQRQKNKKHANTQANKQARKQTNKQTNLTNNQSHTHTQTTVKTNIGWKLHMHLLGNRAQLKSWRQFYTTSGSLITILTLRTAMMTSCLCLLFGTCRTFLSGSARAKCLLSHSDKIHGPMGRMLAKTQQK